MVCYNLFCLIDVYSFYWLNEMYFECDYRYNDEYYEYCRVYYFDF